MLGPCCIHPFCTSYGGNTRKPRFDRWEDTDVTGGEDSAVFWASCSSVTPCSEYTEWDDGRKRNSYSTKLFLREEEHSIFFLAVSQMQKYICALVVWDLESTGIVLHFSEVGYVIQVIRIKLSACALLLFAQNLLHKLLHISLPFHSISGTRQ